MAVYGTTALTLRDYRGKLATTSVVLTSDTAANLLTAAATFQTDFIACSNAVLDHQSGLEYSVEVAASYGAAAEYASVEQKAQLTFVAADGSIHKISVPAPKVAVFATDMVTVVNTGVMATLITFIQASVVAKDSLSALTFLSGYFRERRRKVRLGPWTRTATGGAAPS